MRRASNSQSSHANPNAKKSSVSTGSQTASASTPCVPSRTAANEAATMAGRPLTCRTQRDPAMQFAESMPASRSSVTLGTMPTIGVPSAGGTSALNHIGMRSTEAISWGCQAAVHAARRSSAWLSSSHVGKSSRE